MPPRGVSGKPANAAGTRSKSNKGKSKKKPQTSHPPGADDIRKALQNSSTTSSSVSAFSAAAAASGSESADGSVHATAASNSQEAPVSVWSHAVPAPPPARASIASAPFDPMELNTPPATPKGPINHAVIPPIPPVFGKPQTRGRLQGGNSRSNGPRMEAATRVPQSRGGRSGNSKGAAGKASRPLPQAAIVRILPAPSGSCLSDRSRDRSKNKSMSVSFVMDGEELGEVIPRVRGSSASVVSFRDRIQYGRAPSRKQYGKRNAAAAPAPEPAPSSALSAMSSQLFRNLSFGTGGGSGGGRSGGLLGFDAHDELNASERFYVMGLAALFLRRVMRAVHRMRQRKELETTIAPHAAFVIQCWWRRLQHRNRVKELEAARFLVPWMRLRLHRRRKQLAAVARTLQRVFRGQRERSFVKFMYQQMKYNAALMVVRRYVMRWEAQIHLRLLRIQRDERNVLLMQCHQASLRLLREERVAFVSTTRDAVKSLGIHVILPRWHWEDSVENQTGYRPVVEEYLDPADRKRPVYIQTATAADLESGNTSIPYIDDETGAKLMWEGGISGNAHPVQVQSHVGVEMAGAGSCSESLYYSGAGAPRLAWEGRCSSATHRTELQSVRSVELLHEYSSIVPHKHVSPAASTQFSVPSSNMPGLLEGAPIAADPKDLCNRQQDFSFPAPARGSSLVASALHTQTFLQLLFLPEEAGYLDHPVSPTAIARRAIMNHNFGGRSRQLSRIDIAKSELGAIIAVESGEAVVAHHLHDGGEDGTSVNEASPLLVEHDKCGELPLPMDHDTCPLPLDSSSAALFSQNFTFNSLHTQTHSLPREEVDGIYAAYVDLLLRTESVERKVVERQLLDEHHEFMWPVRVVSQALQMSAQVAPLYAPFLLSMRGITFMKLAVKLFQEEEKQRLAIIDLYDAIPLVYLSRPLFSVAADTRRRAIANVVASTADPLAQAESDEGVFFSKVVSILAYQARQEEEVGSAAAASSSTHDSATSKETAPRGVAADDPLLAPRAPPVKRRRFKVLMVPRNVLEEERSKKKQNPSGHGAEHGKEKEEGAVVPATVAEEVTSVKVAMRQPHGPPVPLLRALDPHIAAARKRPPVAPPVLPNPVSSSLLVDVHGSGYERYKKASGVLGMDENCSSTDEDSISDYDTASGTATVSSRTTASSLPCLQATCSHVAPADIHLNTAVDVEGPATITARLLPSVKSSSTQGLLTRPGSSNFSPPKGLLGGSARGVEQPRVVLPEIDVI